MVVRTVNAGSEVLTYRIVLRVQVYLWKGERVQEKERAGSLLPLTAE
jgi:hypothetical protein